MNPQYRGGFSYSGLKLLARELRKSQTTAEKIFWDTVKKRRFLDLKFRRQHQVGFYIVDFYCSEYNIVIELDGGIHDKPANKKNDAERDLSLKLQGYKVFRFRNERIISELNSVLQELAEYIHLHPSPSGRRAGDEG
jgi:type I restriction enzyme, R subunit